MTTYRLRIEVPLGPPTGATVADAIDEIGGDLVAVELREVDGPRAIDEMVVQFGDTAGVGALSRALDSEPSTTLLSAQRCQLGEPANSAKHWAQDWMSAAHAAVAQLPEDCGVDLAAQLRAACPMASVELRDVQDAHDLPVVSMALARGGPVVQRRVTRVDATGGSGVTTARWLLAAADSYTDAGRIALLERPMSLRFSAYDAARVDLLIGASRR